MSGPQPLLPPDYPGGHHGPPAYEPYPYPRRGRSLLARVLWFLLSRLGYYLLSIAAVPALVVAAASWFFPSEMWFVTKLLLGANDSIVPTDWIDQSLDLWDQMVSVSYGPIPDESGPIEIPLPAGADTEFNIHVEQ